MLGLVGLGSGIAAHVAGGGRLPSAATLALLGVFAVLGTAVFLRTWAGAGRLVGVVVAAQAGWHLVLSLLAGHEGDHVATAAASPAASVMAGPVAAGPAVVGLAEGGRRTGSLRDAFEGAAPTGAGSSGGEGLIAHQIAHVVEQGPLMVLAHLVGAVALGLFVARGEAALWSLVSLTASTLSLALVAGRLVAGVGHGPVAPRVVALITGQVLRPLRLVRDTLRRRGPPVRLAA